MSIVPSQGFLDSIFRNHTGFCVVGRIDRGAHDRKVQYREKFYEWPTQKDAIKRQLELWANVDHFDVYICMQLTDARQRVKINISKATNVWADLDTCHPRKLLLTPTVAWETSPGRYAAAWSLENPVAAAEAAHVAKRVAYFHAADGADRSGHDLTQLLRYPCTRNWKYDGAPRGTLLWSYRTLYRLTDFSMYPDVERSVDKFDSLPDEEPVAYEYLPGLVKWFFEEHEHQTERDPALNNGGPDKSRSWAVFQLIKIAREQGLTNGETMTVLREFGPLIGKVHDEGERWANLEVARMFGKVDEKHPHEGTPCREVEPYCENAPMNEVVRFTLPEGFGVKK